MSVHEYRTGNGGGGGVNGDVAVDAGDAAGARTGMEENEGTQDGNGGRRLVDKHRMTTGTGAGMETRAVAEIGTGTGTGSGRVGERQKNALNRTRAADVMWETRGLGWKDKKCGQERICSVAADLDNLENIKEAGGKHKVPKT